MSDLANKVFDIAYFVENIRKYLLLLFFACIFATFKYTTIGASRLEIEMYELKSYYYDKVTGAFYVKKYHPWYGFGKCESARVGNGSPMNKPAPRVFCFVQNSTNNEDNKRKN